VTGFDVIIIGAGIAGSSLAAELSGSHRVCLLEAEDQPGYHSTGRSNALWHETYGGPLIQPLTAASRGWLDQPPLAYSETSFLNARPTLCIGQEEDAAAMDAFMARFQGTGVALSRLGADGVRAMIPGVRPEWTMGILESASADIDVAAYHAACLKMLRRSGGQVMTSSRVIGLSREEKSWTVRTEKAELRAPIIVNAAGGWADDIAVMAGVAPLSITPLRRTIAQIRVSAVVPQDMPMVTHIHGEFYFKPDGGGRLWVSPHDEHPTPACDAAPEELDIAIAVDRLEHVMDWAVQAVETSWAGLRSFAPDRLPVVGFDATSDGFFWCAGQGGFGIQTAPALSKICAALIARRPTDPNVAHIDPRLYAPRRLRA
jgi:D-arginine dehydrogenase